MVKISQLSICLPCKYVVLIPVILSAVSSVPLPDGSILHPDTMTGLPVYSQTPPLKPDAGLSQPSAVESNSKFNQVSETTKLAGNADHSAVQSIDGDKPNPNDLSAQGLTENTTQVDSNSMEIEPPVQVHGKYTRPIFLNLWA
jgi:hypothetical protein